MILIAGLSGCGKFETKNFDREAQPTSTVITPENPYVTTVPVPDEQTPAAGGDQSSGTTSEPRPQGPQLVMGFLSMARARIVYNGSQKTLKVTGTLTKKSQSGAVEWQSEIELAGPVNDEGFANVMTPASNSSQDLLTNLRGRGMCFEEDGHKCAHAVAEIIYRESSTRAHSLQIETIEPMVRNQGAPPPPPAAGTTPSAQTPAPNRPSVSTTTTTTMRPSGPTPTARPTVTPPVTTPSTPSVPPAQTAPNLQAGEEQSEPIEDDIDEDANPDLYIGQRYEDWRSLYGDEESETQAPSATGGNNASSSGSGSNTPRTTTTTTTTMRPNSPSSSPQTPSTSATTPAPSRPVVGNDPNRPRDQAVGLPYTEVRRNRTTGAVTRAYGSLQNGTYMVTENNKSSAAQRVALYLPGDDHLYGTWELVQLIRAMGNYAHTKQVQLFIGDLAKRGGGLVPPHSSHQNGLDVDIGFPFENAERYGGTPRAVDRQGRLASGFKTRETYDIFKYILSSGSLNMIFVHPTIKAALCREAISRGELNRDRRTGAALELMSRIRPEEDHYNHFHVRIRCSIYQRRCRTLSEPARVTGC